MTTEDAIELISKARIPDDLFGPGKPGYRKLARAVHPDTHPGNAAAEQAFKKLSELRAMQDAGPDPLIARGDIANLYRSGPGELSKIPRDPADSDLIRAEAHALRTLASKAPEKTRAFWPRLTRTTRHRDPATGMIRQVNTIGELDGFVTLEQVKTAYPGGIDPRDAAWMWRRLLFALGGASRAGLVHGAVIPSNVMIHPGEHGLVLIDWCYSGEGPQHRLRAVPRAGRDRYPEAVLDGKPAGYGLDIEMAAAVMTDLIDPALLPRQFRGFARGCLIYNLVSEPDAWGALADFDDLIERLWGPRTFRLFAMPAAGTTTTGRAP